MRGFCVPVTTADGRKESISLYVGEAIAGRHPLQHQVAWWKGVRGIEVPEAVVDAFGRLAEIALENEVSFEELCSYAVGEAEAPVVEAAASTA